MAQQTATKEGNNHSQRILYFDHKDVATLQRFVNQFGQIENRHRSAFNRDKPILRAYEQKRLSQAIKRARFLALMPFINDDTIKT